MTYLKKQRFLHVLGLFPKDVGKLLGLLLLGLKEVGRDELGLGFEPPNHEPREDDDDPLEDPLDDPPEYLLALTSTVN